MLCILTGALPVHMNVSPSLDRTTEEKISEVVTEAAMIVFRMNTPTSTTAALLKRLKPNLSSLEKDWIRDKLKQRISTALKAGGIPQGTIHALKSVYANLLMEGIELGCAQPCGCIVLYFRSLTLEILSRLKEMILSRILLGVLSEVIRLFIHGQSQVHLIVHSEDFEMTVSCLSISAGAAMLLSFNIEN